MNIYPVDENNFSKAIALIKINGLPTEDISDGTKLFALVEYNRVIGTVGIEFYDTVALLRSLVITQEKRNSGLGQQLVSFIEDFAKKNGARELVLLTTTAESFFIKNAYQSIERNNIPEQIKKSSEFSYTCPSSATVMKKFL